MPGWPNLPLAKDVTLAVQALFADGQASGEFREDFDPQAARSAWNSSGSP